MRSIGTWALVGAVCALGLAALVDTFVGGGDDKVAERTSTRERTDSVDTNAALTETLRSLGVRGTITYADTRCGLHVLRLPGLETASAIGAPSCEFTVSPRNTWSPSSTAVDPRTDSRATCIRAGHLELWEDRYGSIYHHTGPGCPPAWTPDGRLTSVWKGGVYLLDMERQDAIALDPVPLLTRAQLARELAGTPWGRNEPYVRQAAWLDDDLVAVIVGAGPGAGGDGLALFRNGRLVAPPLGPYRLLGRLRPSPRGSYVSAVIRNGRQGPLVISDARGEEVALHPSGRAIAWSPDESFGVLGWSDGTIIFKMARIVTQFIRIPIVARDLAWD